MAEWEFNFMCSWPTSSSSPAEALFPDSRAIIADMKRRAATATAADGSGGEHRGLAAPFGALVDAIDESQPAWSNVLPYWPTRGWPGHPARGRVTLAGDAAHPMTPHRGQGLNNAILDCRDLVREVAESLGVAMPLPGQEAKEEGKGAGEVRQEKVLGEPRTSSSRLKEAVERYETKMWERGYEAVMSNLENGIAVHDWGKLMKAPLVRHGVAKQKVDRMEG